MSTFISYSPFSIDDQIYVNKSNGITKLGQTFTSQDTFIITDVSVRIGDAYSAAYSQTHGGTATFEIYAESGNFPTGDILSSGTIEDSLLNGQWHSITMSEYEIQESTTYVLVFYTDYMPLTTSVRHTTWFGTESNGYSGGVPIQYVTSWATTLDIGDFVFKIGGTLADSGYADVTGIITGSGSMTGTVYTTETPAESFAPPTPNAFNMISPTRRLVALAKNSFYYEDV